MASCYGINPHSSISTSLILCNAMLGSRLGVETRLIELDRVMALASQMAFGLERSTSIEASLALGGLGPARMHITRALVRYLCRRQRMELCHIPSLYIHRSYVTPVELGRAWLRWEVLRSMAIDLVGE